MTIFNPSSLLSQPFNRASDHHAILTPHLLVEEDTPRKVLYQTKQRQTSPRLYFFTVHCFCASESSTEGCYSLDIHPNLIPSSFPRCLHPALLCVKGCLIFSTMAMFCWQLPAHLLDRLMATWQDFNISQSSQIEIMNSP